VFASRQVIVGIYENEPKVFINDQGKPSGIFVDIIQLIADREDWELTFASGSWTEGLDRVESGEIDLMSDVAYSPERESRFAFHQTPVIPSWYEIYAPEESSINSLLDLQDKRILVLEGSVQEKAFENIIRGFGLSYTLLPVSDYLNMFSLVSSGEADAAIANNYFGRRHADLFGLKNTSILFEPSDLYFAAPLDGDPEILETIDQHLNRLKEDPSSQYYRILKKWDSDEQSFLMPRWVWLVLITLASIIILIMMWTMTLNSKVRKRTRELTDLNAQMEDKINERTRELKTAMVEAQSADRLKSAFLASMSHELRTPLNSIIGFTGILLQELAGPLNDEQKNQLTMVQKSSRHLLALINDVLDISKIEAGQLDLAHELCSFEQAVTNAVTIVSPLAEKKQIALNTSLPAEPAYFYSDQRRFEQVVINLLQNAIKFTEHGEVNVALTKFDNSYVLKVSDTGIGIKKADIKRLFRPFHQVESGLTRRYEGTGLGLSISKSIISMMGGTVSVESTPGKGSEFTVIIPISDEVLHED
jgi:signal transduction histidine kinase